MCQKRERILNYMKTSPKVKPSYKGDYKRIYLFIIKNIDIFFDFKNLDDEYKTGFNKWKGVYLLDNVYVGRSTNVLSRATNHIMEALGYADENNEEKSEHILKAMKERRLTFEIIDAEPKNENELILQYAKTHKLLNNNGLRKGGAFTIEQIQRFIYKLNIKTQADYLKHRESYNRKARIKLPWYPHHMFEVKWRDMVKEAYTNNQ